MAARKASAVMGDAPPRPSAGEIHEAIERWRHATGVRKAAVDAETEARTALVDLLHRAGLNGFVL